MSNLFSQEELQKFVANTSDTRRDILIDKLKKSESIALLLATETGKSLVENRINKCVELLGKIIEEVLNVKTTEGINVTALQAYAWEMIVNWDFLQDIAILLKLGEGYAKPK